MSFSLIKFLITPMVIGSIVTPLVLPSTSPFYSRSGSFSKEKKDCYIIASNYENKKHFLVCQEDSSLKFYLVKSQADNSLTQEIERIISAVDVGIILKLKSEKGSNESLNIQKGGPFQLIMPILNELNRMPLSNYSCKIEGNDVSKTLNCGGREKRTIPLTKYQKTDN